jgi:hypothetical protein
MVHCFTVQQVPSKKLLCDENVFEHVRMPPCSRVLRNSCDYVTSLVARAASPSVAVGLPSFTPTVATGAISSCFGRPQLHRLLDRDLGHRRWPLVSQGCFVAHFQDRLCCGQKNFQRTPREGRKRAPYRRDRNGAPLVESGCQPSSAPKAFVLVYNGARRLTSRMDGVHVPQGLALREGECRLRGDDQPTHRVRGSSGARLLTLGPGMSRG